MIFELRIRKASDARFFGRFWFGILTPRSKLVCSILKRKTWGERRAAPSPSPLIGRGDVVCISHTLLRGQAEVVYFAGGLTEICTVGQPADILFRGDGKVYAWCVASSDGRAA